MQRSPASFSTALRSSATRKSGTTKGRPAAERASIAAFAAAMGADWAGLDILRDRASGRIYVVDVNKTDAGPIIALPFAEKLQSIALLAAALRDLVTPPEPRLGGGPPDVGCVRRA